MANKDELQKILAAVEKPQYFHDKMFTEMLEKEKGGLSKEASVWTVLMKHVAQLECWAVREDHIKEWMANQ